MARLDLSRGASTLIRWRQQGGAVLGLGQVRLVVERFEGFERLRL